MAGLARHHQRPTRPHPTSDSRRRSRQERALHACPLAGHGGSSLVSGSAQDHLWQNPGLSRAARARFDRSGPGEGVRGQGRSEEHAVHRLEQVGLHTRAQYLQAIFLRPGEGARRREGGWPPLRRHHRSRLEHATDRPSATASGTSSSAGPTSAGAIRRSPTSAWFRPPSWEWMWPKFLDRTEDMVCACMPSVPVEENPGVVLGTILGIAATFGPRQGHDRRFARRFASSAPGWSN